jgi:hypothetical protein
VNRKKEILEIAKTQLPEPNKIAMAMETQLDLTLKVLVELCDSVAGDRKNLSITLQNLLSYADETLKQSCVDFDNLGSDSELYKLPNMIEVKRLTRRVRKQYTAALSKESIN